MYALSKLKAVFFVLAILLKQERRWLIFTSIIERIKGFMPVFTGNTKCIFFHSLLFLKWKPVFTKEHRFQIFKKLGVKFNDLFL